MMTRVNLTIEQGATWRKRFTWKSGTPPVAVDLSGYIARMQMRMSPEASTPLVTLTTENGGITLGGAAGTIDLYIPAATTAGYAWRLGVWDLELVEPGGDVRRLVGGAVSVDPEVTR